jgi:glycine cleavage system H protein
VSKMPNNLKFTESHEWIQVLDDGTAVVGITDYAQTLLGELVYVGLPDAGDVIDIEDDCAVVESVKAASDVYCPVSGQITEINETLLDDPSLVNSSPFDQGWLFKIQIDKPEQLDNLLDASGYQKLVADEAH